MCIRDSGTHCLNENQVFIQGTRDHNTFRFYAEQTYDCLLYTSYNKKTELENLEIINTVRSMVMDKDQIMAFLSSMKGGTKTAENTEVIDNA